MKVDVLCSSISREAREVIRAGVRIIASFD